MRNEQEEENITIITSLNNELSVAEPSLPLQHPPLAVSIDPINTLPYIYSDHFLELLQSCWILQWLVSLKRTPAAEVISSGK